MTKSKFVFNRFKSEGAKLTKPKVTDQMVIDFLKGSYEKQATGRELMGVRAIEFRGNDAHIVFCKEYQKKYGKTHITHKNGLKPYVWAKKVSTKNFFSHNVVILEKHHVSETHVRLPNGQIRKIDGKNIRILRSSKDGSHHTVRYKIQNKKEWDALFKQKKALYGISFKSQITTFDKKVLRMENGFKSYVSIKPKKQPISSDNPYFAVDRRDKIKGVYRNLQNFFREGGINPRGTQYLNEDKLKDYFSGLSFTDRIEFYLAIYKWRHLFNPFDGKSVNWAKIVRLWKKKNPKIAWRVGKDFINALIEKDHAKFFEKLVGYGVNLKDIFNIQLDEDKIIQDVIQAYCFDDFMDKKDLVDYFDKKEVNLWDEKERMIFSVGPLEQYMIQTGVRLFKGIDDDDEKDGYDKLDILVLDIETKAQKGKEHIEKAALKPEHGRVFQVGLKDNKGFEKILHAKKEEDEQEMLEEAYKIIAEVDPDIVLTFYGEGFDFPFMERRLELLGCVSEEWGKTQSTAKQYIRNLVAPYYEKYGDAAFSFFLYNRRENTSVKIGQETKKYTQTKMWGKSCCDGIWALMRAKVNDKTIPNFKLKDNIRHADLERPDRVHVIGDQIGIIDSDTRPYYYNEVNGDYFPSKKWLDFSEDEYDLDKIKEGDKGNSFYDNSKNLYLYTDNGDASDEALEKLSKCDNVFLIKIHIGGKLLSDGNFFSARQVINDNFTQFYNKARNYDRVISPIEGLGKELEGKLASNKVWGHLYSKLCQIRANFEEVSQFYSDVNFDNYRKVSGSFIIERYLSGDLEDPYQLDRLYSQATFAVCKWLPTSYEKVATMGGATVWKLLLAAWSYLNCIAIPDYEPAQSFTGGLVGMVSAGFHKGIVKIDYSSLYPSEFLEHVTVPDIDISGIYKPLVSYGLTTRLRYKKLKNQAKAAGDSKKTRYYDKKQLPLKILINSFYGMMGAPKVSPFCHIDSAWHITCSGRQHMRHLIHYFVPRGFKIIYFHTDGANFVIPEGVDNYKYRGRGRNWLVEKGKEYIGVEAYVAEYNDLFMRGKMGVDIDEYCISCINFSKGNFSYLKEKKGKYVISHVGGSLVSESKSEYITDFVNENLESLFLGDGATFLEAYYDYVLKIYNQNIIAKKIASKKQVKVLPEEYVNSVLEGRNIRLAHMELVLKHNLRVSEGDRVYYINNGCGGYKINSDKTTEDKVLGHMLLDSREQAVAAAKKLKSHGDTNWSYLKKSVEKMEGLGKFEFKFDHPQNPEWSEGLKGKYKVRKTLDISRKVYMNKLDEFDVIKYQAKTFQEKDEDGNIVKEDHMVIIKICRMVLNVVPVAKEDLDAKLPFNADKYIGIFNTTLKNLWVVFHPDIRAKIPSPNRNKNFKRNANQQGLFLDEELELTCGYPLEGDEQKQQELDDLMIITEKEIALWTKLGLSPNSSFEDQKIDVEATYSVVEGDVIKIRKTAEGEGAKMSGECLIKYLCDKPVMDLENPPYIFEAA